MLGEAKLDEIPESPLPNPRHWRMDLLALVALWVFIQLCLTQHLADSIMSV
jgi:hypothetical protein